MTDPKPRPNHAVYLRVLRGMSPEARLRKAFELSAFAQALFRTGLRHRFPHLAEPELERLVRDRLARWATHDIDVVIAIHGSAGGAAGALKAAFPEPEFHLDEEASRAAITERAMFNPIETREGGKVDCSGGRRHRAAARGSSWTPCGSTRSSMGDSINRYSTRGRPGSA